MKYGNHETFFMAAGAAAEEAPSFQTTCLCVGALMIASYVVARRVTWYDDKTGVPKDGLSFKELTDIADNVASLSMFPFAAALALRGTLAVGRQGWSPDGENGWSGILTNTAAVEARWYGATWETVLFQQIYVSRMLLHLPVQTLVLWDKKLLLAQMTAHHVLSMICYGGGLLTGRMHFWAVFDGCCETTTPFLDLLLIFKRYFRPGSTPARLGAQVSGFILWLLFLVMRLVLFSAWLFLFYHDVTTFTHLTWDRVTFPERWLYPATTLILLLLSAGWFHKLTLGMLKACGFVKKKSKRRNSKQRVKCCGIAQPIRKDD